MAYVKQTWVDRVVQFANRFTKSGETSASVTLTPDPGTVTQAGSPLSAARMNYIEQGIFDAHSAVDTVQNNLNTKATQDAEYRTKVRMGAM